MTGVRIAISKEVIALDGRKLRRLFLNFAILRYIALNLLKCDSASKLGIKNRRLQAGWDNDYLCSVLEPLFL